MFTLSLSGDGDESHMNPKRNLDVVKNEMNSKRKINVAKKKRYTFVSNMSASNHFFSVKQLMYQIL